MQKIKNRILIVACIIFLGLYAVEKYDNYTRDQIIIELTSPTLERSSFVRFLDNDEFVEKYDIQTSFYCVNNVEGIDDCQGGVLDLFIIKTNTFGYEINVAIKADNDTDFSQKVERIKSELVRSDFKLVTNVAEKIVISISSADKTETFFVDADNFTKMQTQHVDTNNFDDLFIVIPNDWKE